MKKRKERIRRKPSTFSKESAQDFPAKGKLADAAMAPSSNATSLAPRLVMGMLILVTGAWAYFPTLVSLVTAWNREPDYSHGYLVLPIALSLLWLRRSSYPGITNSGMCLGGLLIVASTAMRLIAGAYFIESADAWSMLAWLAGSVAIIFGSSLLRWSAASIGFLIFMIPLPYRIEGVLSLPLQRIATKLSCSGLQILGLPAIAEGNTILLSDHQPLEVAQACSGLRLFFSILALGVAYSMTFRKTWWQTVLILASVIPIAIIANAVRIIATGLLFEFTSSDLAHQFSHDYAGFAMIPMAAAMFWLVLWYLGKAIQVHEHIQVYEHIGVESVLARVRE